MWHAGGRSQTARGPILMQSSALQLLTCTKPTQTFYAADVPISDSGSFIVADALRHVADSETFVFIQFAAKFRT